MLTAVGGSRASNSIIVLLKHSIVILLAMGVF